MQPSPSPENPVILPEGYENVRSYVVGLSTNYDWAPEWEKWSGYLLVHNTKVDLSKRHDRRQRKGTIEHHISDLRNQLGHLTKEQKGADVSAWIHMRDELLAGHSVQNVPFLKTGEWGFDK